MRVLAIIPAHNEEARLGRVVAGAAVRLPVLVIDDGSTDATRAAAESAGAEVLRLVPNRGKGAALRAGFRAAIERGFEAVVTLDGDGQHDPAEIPSLLQSFRADRPDLVIGARDFGGMPPVRRLANTLGRKVLRLAVGEDLPDNQSGYRIVSRRLMEASLASEEPGFGFEVEMIVTCLRRGWRIEWVPIRTIYAGEASHIRPLTHLWRFLRLAFRLRRRGAPPGR